MASPEDDDDLIPDSGAVFTFGRSRFADNLANKFWIKNDPVLQVDCGDEHSAVVTERGRVYVFGSNDWGQLGLGHKKASIKPAFLKVLKPEKILQVACGRTHTLAYAESKKLYSFGGNEDGQLGHGNNENHLSPQLIEELEGVRLKSISCGAYHCAVLTEDGQVYVWGNNGEGQLGLGSDEAEVVSPTLLSIDCDIISISCGYYHTALVSSEGLVYTFGEDETGKLGLEGSQLNDTSRPQSVVTLDNDSYIQVSCGARHTVAITKKGRCYSWGDGSHGQLGHGTMCQEATAPKLVESLSGYKIVKASCGDSHSAVVTDNGNILTFGDGRHGKLGQGDECFSNLFKPTLITRFKGFHVNSVSCGGCHMLVRAIRRADEEFFNDEEDGGEESLMSSIRSEYSLKEANMTLRPDNTFPTVSSRDKRRRKDSDALSKSLSLNGSLNNSLNLAQLSRRDLPQLPSSLDKSKLPIIPGMDLGKKKLEPIEKPSDRRLDSGEPLTNDLKMQKNKRLVAEISFSRKREDNNLPKPIPSPRTRHDKNELPKLDINDNIQSSEEERNDRKRNIDGIKSKINFKESDRTEHVQDNDSTYESQEEDEVLKVQQNKQGDDSKNKSNLKRNHKKDNKKGKETSEGDDDEEVESADEEHEERHRKKTKPTPAPRNVFKKHKVEKSTREEEEEDEEEEESEYDTEEEDEEEESEEEESEEEESEEEEVPAKKPSKSKQIKAKSKISNKKQQIAKYEEEDDEEGEEEEESEEEEEESEEEEEGTKHKKKKMDGKKIKVVEKIKSKKKKMEVEDEDEEDEVDEDTDKEEKKSKKKNGKVGTKKKKDKRFEDDDPEEEDEEEDEIDGKKRKSLKKKKGNKKQKKQEDAENEDENEEDEIEDAEENKEDENTKKEEEPKSGFFNFFRRNKKLQPLAKDKEGTAGSGGSKSSSPVPDQQKSKTCTVL